MTRLRQAGLSPHPSGGFRVVLYRAPAVIRPNRQAAGLSFTRSRNAGLQRKLAAGLIGANDALRLAVRGTLDTLTGKAFHVARVACPCCGHKAAGKLRLNDSGQLRLRIVRRRRKSSWTGERLFPTGFTAWARLFPE